ncbi:jg15610 [Pararge aegeria aegeria]|uniref:Jg15610 protein n=1 Tax=Pararge aegeria aegeria TaxID=348720 RepID=A0A8S4RSW6_9NEOP|nr:jg15610 [Pararge aegeria aegeria]
MFLQLSSIVAMLCSSLRDVVVGIITATRRWAQGGTLQMPVHSRYEGKTEDGRAFLAFAVRIKKKEAKRFVRLGGISTTYWFRFFRCSMVERRSKSNSSSAHSPKCIL